MSEASEDHDFRKYLAGGEYKVCTCGCDFYPDDDEDKYCPDCIEDEGRGTINRGFKKA